MSIWRIRKADHGIYGPVEWGDVCRWANEGRILPDDTLSENGGPWQPATAFAALELDWLLERPDGTTVGPLPAKVFAESVRKRILTGGEWVRHRTSGARQTTAQLALAEINLENERLRQAVVEAERVAVLSSRPEKADATGLEKSFQDLTRRYEALLARTREQDDTIKALRRQLAEAQAGPQSKLNELQESLRRASADVERGQRKIAELETRLTELARDHRDLNERYIRLRDEGPGGSAAPSGKPKVRLA